MGVGEQGTGSPPGNAPRRPSQAPVLGGSVPGVAGLSGKAPFESSSSVEPAFISQRLFGAALLRRGLMACGPSGPEGRC